MEQATVAVVSLVQGTKDKIVLRKPLRKPFVPHSSGFTHSVSDRSQEKLHLGSPRFLLGSDEITCTQDRMAAAPEISETPFMLSSWYWCVCLSSPCTSHSKHYGYFVP